MFKSLMKYGKTLFHIGIGVVLTIIVGGAASGVFAANGTVDLTNSIGPGASFIGMPAHGAWCTDLSVPEDKQTSASATFPVLSGTEVFFVGNNYSEVWTVDPVKYGESSEGTSFTLTGTTGKVTFVYGVSGTVKVCFGPKTGAPHWGKFGVGTAPTATESKQYFVDDVAYSYGLFTSLHHKRHVLNLKVDPLATSVKFTRYEGTGVKAWMRYQQEDTGKWVSVPLTVACDGSQVCTVTTPTNVMFGDFATEPSITIAVKWDSTLKSEEPNVIGIKP